MISMKNFLILSLLVIGITQNIECRPGVDEATHLSSTKAKNINDEAVIFDSVPAKQINAEAGTSLSVLCEARGNPKPMISWYRNGQPISENVVESNKDEKFRKEAFKVGSRLYLDCVQPEDSAEYTCVAKNSKSEAKYSFHVNVEEASEFAIDEYSHSLCELRSNGSSPARITLWTRIMLRTQNTDAEIYCRSTGNPKPSVSWYMSYGDEDDDLVEIKNSEKYEIKENGDLIIKDLKWLDLKEYYCYVHNLYGSDSQRTFIYPLK
ncbi:neural/ectodermal development factor IMP-L2-like protein, partial [Dinothrombium tinctorium]